MAGDRRHRHRPGDLRRVALLDRSATAVRGDHDHHRLRDCLPGRPGARDADGRDGQHGAGCRQRHLVQERVGARRRHQARRHRLRQDRHAHRRPAGGRRDRDGRRRRGGRGADRRRRRRAGLRPSAGAGHRATGGQAHHRGADRLREPRRDGRPSGDRCRNRVPRQPPADGHGKTSRSATWMRKRRACRARAERWSTCLRPVA